MRKTLTLLVATTALTAAIGAPSWSAVRDQAAPLVPALFEDSARALPLLFVSDDDDDDDRRYRETSRRGHDDDDDDDDDECRRGGNNPAPAGTVAPPQNGLFGNGAPPQVQVN